MRFYKFALPLVLFIQFGCTAPFILLLPSQPLPFQKMPRNDQIAENEIKMGNNRLLTLEAEESYSKILNGLLKMGCTITTSDSSAKLVSFERVRREPETPKLHKGPGYDAAILTGTIRVTKEIGGSRCVVVLAGKINWRTSDERGTGRTMENVPDLAPSEYKQFLDDLCSKM